MHYVDNNGWENWMVYISSTSRLVIGTYQRIQNGVGTHNLNSRSQNLNFSDSVEFTCPNTEDITRMLLMSSSCTSRPLGRNLLHLCFKELALSCIKQMKGITELSLKHLFLME